MTEVDPVRALAEARPWGEVLKAADATVAEQVAPGIYMSEGTSNAYMVLTDAGRVIVNTGLGFEAYTHKKVFDAVCAGPTTHILITQGHVDHVGGVGLFREAGTRFVAQANNPSCQADDARIAKRRQAQSYTWFKDVIDRALVVARTDVDVPKHKGLTYFVIDMHGPGVEARPLRQMTGQAEFNEVYFTDARIPDAHRLGGVGDG